MREVLSASGLYWQVLHRPHGRVSLRFTGAPTFVGELKGKVSIGPDSVEMDVEMSAGQAVDLAETLKGLALAWDDDET